ncbi:MAG: hypothetical protein RIR79_1520 [Pseudomonadota bacterium]|jgi:KDO2-lipid IV(A) lauroyltransferase
MLTRFFLFFTRLLALLPLPLLRAVGWILGNIAYRLMRSRRKVVHTNLRLCFPQWSESEIQCRAREVFGYVMQSWLDRGWLWHASPALLKKRLHLVGAVHELEGNAPTVIFAPHFVAMDAGWTVLTQQINRPFAVIYAAQSNKDVDAWIVQGRKRFGNVQLFQRVEGVRSEIKSMISSLREGMALCILPDMNYDPRESFFVPFYGVPAATIPSLSRFAKLGRAKVVPVISRMTEKGYAIEVLAAWENYPTHDAVADTAFMNAQLETYINTMPSQYYWVHKRFKDRPNGELAPY